MFSFVFEGANLRFAMLRVEVANLNLKNYVVATEQKKQPRILAFLPAGGEKFFLRSSWNHFLQCCRVKNYTKHLSKNYHPVTQCCFFSPCFTKLHVKHHPPTARRHLRRDPPDKRRGKMVNMEKTSGNCFDFLKVVGQDHIKYSPTAGFTLIYHVRK